MFTEQEKIYLGMACCDLETGHHLLIKRDPEYYPILNKLFKVIGKVADNIELVTDEEKYIFEYYRQMTDYDYYMSLPEDKRL